MNRRQWMGGALAAAAPAWAAAQKKSEWAGLYNVRDFGARGDGRTNDTEAVQKAVDACSKTGGRLVFPPGVYMTGTVRLKSHVTIELLNRAVWKGIADRSLYPDIKVNSRPVFLFAENAEEIHITGQGMIHGGGENHDVWIKEPGDWRTIPRAYGLLFWKCRNVSLTGVTFKSSVFWMLRPDHCEDVMIRGIKIYNHANYNNDGIDVCDCHRVVIADCILDCEDDSICLKSHSTYGVEDVTVTNCVVSSHASAIKFGTASRGKFNRIAISNCVVKPSAERTTLHPLQFIDGLEGIDLASVDGAELTNVSIGNIVMDGVHTPYFVRLGRRNNYGDASRKDSRAPGVVDNLTLSNIQAVNSGVVSCSISGYPGQYVRNVKLQNIDVGLRVAGTQKDAATPAPERDASYPNNLMFRVNMPSYGLFLRHVKDVSIDGMVMRPTPGEARPEMVVDDVHGAHLSRIRTAHPERETPQVKITNSSGVRLDGKLTG